MQKYLEIMTEVIRLVTFQEQLHRSVEEDPGRREHHAAEGSLKPRIGCRRHHDSVE